MILWLLFAVLSWTEVLVTVLLLRDCRSRAWQAVLVVVPFGVLAYLVVVKRRDGWALWPRIAQGLGESWRRSRRYWAANAVATLAAAALVVGAGRSVAAAARDSRTALPMPTQWLIDQAHTLQTLVPPLLGLFGVHLAYWWGEARVRAAGAGPGSLRVYRWAALANIAAFALAAAAAWALGARLDQ